MKWLVFSYFFFFFLFYGICLFLKFKKKTFFKEFFFWFICFFNTIFLFGCVFSYQFLEEREFLLKKEYENIIFTHEDILDISSLLQKNYSEVKEEIISLENEIDTLGESKEKISEEIQSLQNKYYLLTVEQNIENLNTAYEEYQIPNFPTYDQRTYYPNGCESISLYLLLKYNEVEVSPETIVATLKKGDTPHMEGNVKYGGDPEIEFVGNPKDNSGYGVFEDPIIDVANQFKPGIKKVTGISLSDVLKIVEQGYPVQVWASSYQRTPTKCNTWIHKESGKTITWYCNFHSLVVIGYANNKIIVSDPLTGTIVRYDRKKFEAAYNFYGRRAIYYE